MDKKELSQLRHLNKEIELLKKQMADAEYAVKTHTTQDVVSGSNPVWPYQKKAFHIEGVAIPEYEERVKRLRKKLQRKLEELMKKRDALEKYITTIEDSELRTIFTLRYIDGLSWRQIAARIGVAGDGSTERKKHDRFLKLSRLSSK